jgi:hypothetical protein
MGNDNNSLDKISEILKKIDTLLKENNAFIVRSDISTEARGMRPYAATITIELK